MCTKRKETIEGTIAYFLLKRLITPDLFDKPIHVTIACRSQSKGQFSEGLSLDLREKAAVNFAFDRFLRQKRIIMRFDASHMSSVLAATRRKVRNSEYQSVNAFILSQTTRTSGIMHVVVGRRDRKRG